MRVLALVGLLAVAHPVFAQAQVPADESGAAPAPAQTSSAPLRLTPVGQVPLGPARGYKSISCCSEKGALVGAAIGATLGFMLTYYADDSGDRSGHLIAAPMLLGAFGAG